MGSRALKRWDGVGMGDPWYYQEVLEVFKNNSILAYLLLKTPCGLR